MNYDKIIIGAGLYGLYSAVYCGKKGEKILVLECDSVPFARATYINQARVHMGYHDPRSLSTAGKSRGYFDRFCEDYPESVKDDFTLTPGSEAFFILLFLFKKLNSANISLYYTAKRVLPQGGRALFLQKNPVPVTCVSV